MTNPFKNSKEAENEEIKPEAETPDEFLKAETETADKNTTSGLADKENDVAEEDCELNKIKTDFEKLNNQYIRLAADFDNYRKRQEQERENLIKYGAADTLTKMLEILDNFERGEKALETVEDCQVVKDNFNRLHKQTLDVLTKLGLEVIETEGKEFDPGFHEAVMQTPTSEHPEHAIISELQKGYKLGGKILRPSLVNVAVPE